MLRRQRKPKPPLSLGLLRRLLRIDEQRGDSFFDPPSSAEVIVVTHILELPRDLAIPDKKVTVLFEPRADVFVGWPDNVKAAFVGAPAIPVPGASPVTRAVFRRVVVRGRLPLEAAEMAFRSFERPLVNQRTWWLREISLKFMSRRGLYEWTTVVAVTRFVPPGEWPTGAEGQTSLLRRELSESITFLNRFILALGLVRSNVTLAPIAEGDLPAMCPVVIEIAPMPGKRVGRSFIYPIHGIFPSLREAPEDGSFETAGRLARLEYHGQEPFFLFYELMHTAGAASIASRFTQEVIGIGTAIEVLVATVIRESAKAMGEDATRVDGMLNAGLRNQVVDHLPRYAPMTVDLEDEDTPAGAWWQCGYLLRNRVVHEGHRPTEVEAAEARRGAFRFIATVREGLLANEQTKALGELLQWGSLEDLADGTT